MTTNRQDEKLWWRLVRFGFRLLYNELAFTYDTVANVVSMGAWWRWQGAALRYLPAPNAGTLLDLAHGTGRFHIALQGMGYRVVGFDLSRAMGRITARRLRRRKLPQRLARGMAQQLPFSDGAFAAIVSTFPTPFIVQPATIAEMQRVLAANGVLVMVLSAVFKGRGLPEAALESAYAATGQRPDWGADFIEPFEKGGFSVNKEWVDLGRNRVLVVVAQKVI